MQFIVSLPTSSRSCWGVSRASSWQRYVSSWGAQVRRISWVREARPAGRVVVEWPPLISREFPAGHLS